MKLIKPSVELIEQKPGLIGIYKQIERAGRICYKSEDRITEDSAKKFVDMLIKNGHGAMLEHGTIYLKISIPKKAWFKTVVDKYYNNPYSKANNTFDDHDYHYFITTNYRVLVENGWLDDLQYLCEPTPYHQKRYTFHFVTSIGITREIIRHRHMSFANESTRYCNYSKKGNDGIVFVIPSFLMGTVPTGDNETIQKYCEKTENHPVRNYLLQIRNTELAYKLMIIDGYKPQEAREILPMCTKSEIIVTGFESDWEDFLRLRCAKDAHPDMQIIANKAKEFFPAHTY